MYLSVGLCQTFVTHPENYEDFSIIFRSGALPGLISNNFRQKSTFGERLDNLLGQRTFLTNVPKFLVGG